MADKYSTLTKDFLHYLFDYKDGKLFWKIHTSNRKVGDRAGTLDCRGYRNIRIKKYCYREHRLIFLMHYGYLPKYLDHIDNNRSNNLIQNLRETTASQNNMNKRIYKRNTSGVKGVAWIQSKQKWRARCIKNGKYYVAGHFEKLEDAKDAIESLRNKLHGDFARHI